MLVLLGGVTFGGMARCYAITVAAVLSSALICLAASMRSRKTSTAFIRGLLWTVFWHFGLMVLLAMLAFPILMGRGGPPNWIALLAGLSPIYAAPLEIALTVMRSDAGMRIFTGFPVPLWLVSVAWSSVVGAAHLAFILRGMGLPDLVTAGERRREKRRRKRRIVRCLFAKGLLLLGETGIPLVSNPVFLKEIRSEAFGRPWFRRAGFWGPLAIFAIIIFSFSSIRWGGSLDDLAQPIAGIALFLGTLLAGGYSAASFTREIDQGNIDFLRGTLLTGWTSSRGSSSRHCTPPQDLSSPRDGAFS